MSTFIRKHPVGVAAGTLVVGTLAWLAFGFFGIHTLFVDDVVDEAAPVFAATAAADTTQPDARRNATSSASAPASTSGATPGAIASPAGTQRPDLTPPPEVTPAQPPSSGGPADQPVASPAPAAPEIVTELRGAFESDAHPTSGEALVLGNGTGQRFLRFENFVTDNGPDLNVYLVNSSTGDVSDYVDLGDLTGNIGDQNYEIPSGLDLSVYDEVVIWCVRFGVGFGDARLTPA